MKASFVHMTITIHPPFKVQALGISEIVHFDVMWQLNRNVKFFALTFITLLTKYARYVIYFRHVNTFIGLFWFLFGGGGEEKSISVRDQEFLLVTEFGRIFMGAYVICTGMVALNMLVAMMNDSFRRIMVCGIDKESRKNPLP